MLACKPVTYRRQQGKKKRKEDRKDKLRAKHGTTTRIPQLSVLSKSRENCSQGYRWERYVVPKHDDKPPSLRNKPEEQRSVLHIGKSLKSHYSFC